MATRAASPSPLSLIASLGALGGAVPGWNGVMWLVRLVTMLGAPARSNAPWVALWSMLQRIAGGDVSLQGCAVQEGSVCRGSARVDFTRITMLADVDGSGEMREISVTVETVTVVNAEFLPWGRHLVPAGSKLMAVAQHFTKLVLGFPPSHAHFVTLS